jgi:fumarate hydratase class II
MNSFGGKLVQVPKSMNVNEVVANRAQVLKGFAIGEEQFIKTNDDVNKSQSSNDTFQLECTLLLTAVVGY